MSGTKEKYSRIFSSIDETIKNLAERKNISYSEIAALLGMSDASLRGKRRGATEFTLFEILELQRFSGEKILAPFDESLASEPPAHYKVSSNKDKSAQIEKIKDAIPAPVFNYYITLS